jgi:hypothetical protein
VVRFLPSDYIAPHRISHDLTERQRHLLQHLSIDDDQGSTFAAIKAKLSNPPADRTLRDDFQHLKRLGLIDVSGHGRGAKWHLMETGNKALAIFPKINFLIILILLRSYLIIGEIYSIQLNHFSDIID